jgi:cytochrome c oxidase subunit 4
MSMAEHNSASEHVSQHVSTIGSSVAIWIALLVCTGLTVGAAFVDLGPFMHVKYTHEKLTGLVVVSAIFWLFLLLALSMLDYTTRFWR